MKGFISTQRWVGGLVVGLFVTVSGCSNYHKLVDPCWPQRWNAIAREEVREPLAAQVNNGLVLEQTLWNHHFEYMDVVQPNGVIVRTPTARLSSAGKSHLDRLIRRRPLPLPDVFVQTTHEVSYDPAMKIEDYRQLRDRLDGERVEAVRRYLMATRPEVAFNITVHDPAPVGMLAPEANDLVGKHLSATVGAFAPTAGAANKNTQQAFGTQFNQSQQQVDQNVKQGVDQNVTQPPGAAGPAPGVPPVPPVPPPAVNQN
jgi:hypothetical protein